MAALMKGRSSIAFFYCCKKRLFAPDKRWQIFVTTDL